MNLSKRTKSSQIVTRSRSRNYQSDEIPQDMVEQILLKLKAKHICKFIAVSKTWSSIICSKGFAELYLTRSMTQPRILFSISRTEVNMQNFYSVSLENPCADHYRISYNTLYQRNKYYFSPPVRGLISCLNCNNRVVIGNPSTGEFITLPRVKTSRKNIISLFGYDSNADAYKVLCMAVSKDGVSEEHQVFTLGAGNKKWKMIECELLYNFYLGTQEIYIGGVVYYLALINEVQSLICFDMRSEKFGVIKLPSDVLYILNYGEKIAVTHMFFEMTVDLWVLKDVRNQEWSKISIPVPWPELYIHPSIFYHPQTFDLKGTIGTGELIFAPNFSMSPNFYLVCYDLKKNEVRQIWIDGIEASDSLQVFLNHVESPMFLKV